MTAMAIKLLVIAVVAGNFFAFGWVIQNHFARPDGMTGETRVMALFGSVFILAQLVAHALAPDWVTWRLLLGLSLCGLSTCLLTAAFRANREKPLSLAGSNDEPHHLNQRGPYARIRHPFYAAYFCTWLGAGIISPHVWMLIPALVMGSLYWRSARAEERKFLSSALADDYRAYQQRSGMFWPRFF